MEFIRQIGPANKTKPLNFYDIFDERTQQFKPITKAVYYNNVKVIWPPEMTRVDEITFNLENGDQIERYFGENIDDNGIIEDMEIELPQNPNAMAAGRKRRTKRNRRTKSNKNKRKQTNKRKIIYK